MACLFDADFGTRLNLSDDGYAQISFSQGFSFNFYGTTYSSVFVNANGSLTFTNGSSSFVPTFPGFINNNPRIAAFWIDLVESPLPGGTFYKQLPDRLIITWNMARYFPASLPINTFQIILCSNGLIGFGYESLENDKSHFPWNSFPLIGVAAGSGGPSGIFKYDPPQNFDPQQTVEGPQGILNDTQLFWIYNGSEYVLIDRVISFSATVVIPDGMAVDPSRPPLAGLNTAGLDCMNCVLEPMTVPASIPDPCSCNCGSHICLVEVNALRGIGFIGVCGAVPVTGEGNSTETYICTSTYVCFNKILCLECKNTANPCDDPAFFASAAVQNVQLSSLFTEMPNGDKIYELSGLIKLLPCCDIDTDNTGDTDTNDTDAA